MLDGSVLTRVGRNTSARHTHTRAFTHVATPGESKRRTCRSIHGAADGEELLRHLHVDVVCAMRRLRHADVCEVPQIDSDPDRSRSGNVAARHRDDDPPTARVDGDRHRLDRVLREADEHGLRWCSGRGRSGAARRCSRGAGAASRRGARRRRRRRSASTGLRRRRGRCCRCSLRHVWHLLYDGRLARADALGRHSRTLVLEARQLVLRRYLLLVLRGT